MHLITSIFKLYEVSSIDSNKFGDSLDSKALESILGENFLKISLY